MTRVLALLGIAGCAAPGTPWSPVIAPQPLVLTNPPPRLEVRCGSGDVRVYVSDADEIRIVPLSSADDGWTWSEDPGAFSVASICANGQPGCGTGFVVEVPADVELDLATLSGTTVVGPGFAGIATVTMRTGALWGEGVGEADLTILGGSGAITLTHDRPPRRVVATTDTADIALTVPAGMYSYQIETSGDTTVHRIAQGDGPTVHLASTTGAILLLGE